MSLESDVEAALPGARRRGATFDFLCVSCDDGENPAANWDPRKDVWGCAKCGAGGPTIDLARRLGLQVESARERAAKSRIVAEYDYRDEAGNLRFQVVREIPKSFKRRRPDGAGGWIWQGVEPPSLYRLPELIASTGRVYIVEGEKDVEAMRSRGGVATSNPGGASETGKSKWRPEIFNHFLAGRDVVVLPDRDRAGDNHAAFVAASLLGTARSVKILVLPQLEWKAKKGPDISDWFEGGAEFGELEELADAAPEYLASVRTDETGLVFRRTDAGNAELYAHLYGDRVRYDHQRSRWLTWDTHRWGADRDGQMWRWATDAARWRGRAAFDGPPGGDRDDQAKWASASESTAKISAMFTQLQAVPPVADTGTGWDANPMLLGCVNGVLNLATGEFRAGRADDRLTLSCGIVYDPTATCPTWMGFLEDVFGDGEVASFLQRAIGYTITGSTREQVWFLCFGNGGNGKSTYLETLLMLLGGLAPDSYAADTPTDTLGKRAPTIPVDIAALVNKRYVMCSESDSLASLNTGRIKSLTGGDPQTARFMRENLFSFTPALKLWLQTNHLPRVDDPTDGFWRRVILVPFNRKFEGAERDLDIKTKLLGELPGILNWALAGCLAWRKDGLRPPRSVLLATLDFRWEADPVGDFKTECCIVEKAARTTPLEMYRLYLGWAERQGIPERGRMGRDIFLRLLADGGFRSTKNNGKRVINGIRPRRDDDLANTEMIDQNGQNHTLSQVFESEVPGSLGTSGHLSHEISTDFQALSSRKNQPENGDKDVPTSLGPELCPCDTDCPAPAEGGIGCDGAPMWLDEDLAGHCSAHHKRG